MKTGLLVSLVCVLVLRTAGAQHVVTGTVIEDESSSALPGVTVVLKGTSQGTSTDGEGVFTIDTGTPDVILVFSFVGFITQEVTLTPGDSALLVRLAPTVLGLEAAVVVGSRRLPRMVKDSAVPVDVLSPGELASSFSTDMDDMLQTQVPSYYVQRTGGDEAKLVRPATLRGLPTDNVLVLVNGKRRHRSGSIALSGNSLNEGSHGPDLNMVPGIAIKRIELLRDGASAQYGADAVAGVFNLLLRDAPHGVLVRLQGGQFLAGDGQNMKVSANAGFPIGRSGFINLSMEYRDVGPTVRSAQRDDARILQSRGYPVADPAQTWGDPDIDLAVVGFVNAGVDLGRYMHAYAFGGIGTRSSEGGFFFRAPGTVNARGSVFRFGSGDSATRAVLDLDEDDDIVCRDLPDLPGLDSDKAAIDRFIGSYSGECFLFNEIFPGGFTPTFGADISDFSLVSGLRGGSNTGIQWDASVGIARSIIDYFIYDTVNASYGPDTPTSFRPRDYIQEEITASLDLTYPLQVGGLASPMNIAWGAQWRKEIFESRAGDIHSYQPGPYASQGFSVGSNGYQGLHPQFAGVWGRPNYAFYADLEADVTQALVLGVAARFEDFYDDFGSTLKGKVAALYRMADRVSLRGTMSTGLRAPSPGQSNLTVFRTTSFSTEHGLIEVGHVPPTHPIAVGLGGKALKEETATSFSLGAVLELRDDLSLTADYFDISFEDRISVTGNIPITNELVRIIDEQDILGGVSNIREIRFYSNDFDTRTRGVDVLLTWNRRWAQGNTTTATIAWNWTETSLMDHAPPQQIREFLGTRLVEPVTLSLLTRQRQVEIEEISPAHRAIISGHHEFAPFSARARLSYYDGWKACRFRSSACQADGISTLDSYDSVWLIDVEIGYSYRQDYSIALGMHNFTDAAPQAHPEETARQGNLHPRSAGWDSNGAAWYVRVTADLD